jgi:hypothetical protein
MLILIVENPGWIFLILKLALQLASFILYTWNIALLL